MAGIKTTLLLMYFVTTPMHVSEHESKESIEKRSVWTFQSATQIEMPSANACETIGNILIEEIKPVNTMTIRAYCLCEKGTGKQCKDLDPSATALTTTPTVQPLGPLARRNRGSR